MVYTCAGIVKYISLGASVEVGDVTMGKIGSPPALATTQ